MVFRIEPPGDQIGREASVRSADLMGAGWEEFPDESDDPRLDAGDGSGYFQVIDTAEGFTDRVIAPVYPEQVQRMQVVDIDVFKLLFDLFWNGMRIFQLFEGRKNQMLLSAVVDRLMQKVCTLNLPVPFFHLVSKVLVYVKGTIKIATLRDKFKENFCGCGGDGRGCFSCDHKINIS